MLKAFLKNVREGPTQLVLGIIIFFIFIRFLIILFGSSHFFCESELYRGTIAREILTNWGWPIWAYQNEAHTGGSLMMSLSIIPFFAVFPQNLITIKIIALIFSLLTLQCVYYFTYRCLNNPKAALLTLLWFVFAPPLYLIYSTVLMGEHYESQLFSFLSFILFYKMTDPQISSQKRLIFTALFGLTCGFSLYFSFTFLITLITCLLGWFFIDRIFFLRMNFVAFIICATIGFIPHLLYNSTLKLYPWTIHGQSILNHINVGYSTLAERFHFLLTFYWPHGLWLGDLGNVETFPLLGSLLGILFIIAYFVVGIEKTRTITANHQWVDNRAWFLVLFYPIVFIALNILTDFYDEFLRFPLEAYAWIDDYTEFKYVFVLFPFVFIIISFFLVHINQGSRKNPLIKFVMPILICVFFWSMSMLDVTRLTAIGNFDLHVQRWRSNSYHLLGEHVFRSFSQSTLEQKNEYIEKIKMPYRKFAYIGFGYQIADEDVSHELLTEALSLVKQECKRYFIVGLGAACAEHILQEKASLEDACPFAKDIPTDFHRDFIEGLGVGMGADIHGIPDMNLPDQDMPAYYQGFAIGKLRLFRYDLDRIFEEMEDIPLLYRNDFYTGLNKYSDYLIDFEIDRQKLNGFLTRL